MKPVSHIGSLCLIACTLTPLIFTYPALAQSTSSYLPGDTPPPSERPADADIDTFYTELSPYGRWVDTPEYGRVWIPTVEAGFVPYATNGYWIVTNYGNTWVSNYPWGWAAFHYGRWYRHNSWGWVWVPGRIWGPAWVTWRSGDGYYGWAPLGPSVTININIPLFWWTYVPQTYITDRYIYNYYVPATRVVEVHRNTTVIVNNYKIDNRTYIYGPKRQEIERVTNNKVSIYRVDRVNKPAATRVEGNTIRIYQPAAFNNKRDRRNTTVIQERTNDRNTTRHTNRQETVITPDRIRSTETRRTYRPESNSTNESTENRRTNRREWNSDDESINRRTHRREWNSGETRRTYRQESGSSDESTNRRSDRQEYSTPTMPSNNSASERQRAVDREFSTERSGGRSRSERFDRESGGEGFGSRGGGRHNRDR